MKFPVIQVNSKNQVLIPHINHAISPKAHTPMYVMHKFWARKPHNVVNEYIKHYSKKGEIILDPFSGSGPSAIEAIKEGRKAVAIDLNPIANFITRITAVPVELDKLRHTYRKIKDNVEKEILNFYKTTCLSCHKQVTIICCVWEREKNELQEVRYFCPKCNERLSKIPDEEDLEGIRQLDLKKIEDWYPKDALRYSNSVEFKEGTHVQGLDTIPNLFTHRNLRSLSIIYREIENIDDQLEKDVFKFAFTSMVHLASNMTPVRPTRPFSSFWPVHRYWIPPIYMESNVWLLFESAVEGRQGILKGKEDSNSQIKRFQEAKTFDDLLNDANILISNQSSLDLSEIPSASIDYVFTDPPYGGSIQYFELSTLWISWLKGMHNDVKFNLNFKDEVTINENQGKDFEYYHNMLRRAFEEVHRVLKAGRWLTVTFHNTDIKIYNSIIKAIVLAGFDLEKTVYQPPARASAKGLLQPYGSAVGDYYIRFRKPEKRSTMKKASEIDNVRYERIVVDTVKRMIGERGEPIAYSIIINSYPTIYEELKNRGYLFSAPESIGEILKKNLNNEFTLIDVKNEKGKIIGQKWWLQGVSFLDRVPLSERVEKATINVLNRKHIVSFDEVLEEIFIAFPNSLTPDTQSIKSILEDYAEKTRDGKWRLKSFVRRRESEHDYMVKTLAQLGKKIGFNVYADIPKWRSKLDLPIPKENLARIREIDVIWYTKDEIKHEFEVENTTGITEAIVRGSNILSTTTKRYIVIPEEREDFFYRKISEPMLQEKIEQFGWGFIFYDSLRVFYEQNRRKRKLDVLEFEKLGRIPKLRDVKQQTMQDFI